MLRATILKLHTFFCLGAIGGKIYINNLKHDSLQGIKNYYSFRTGKCVCKTTADGYYLEKQNLKLIDNEFDLLDTPDLAPNFVSITKYG